MITWITGLSLRLKLIGLAMASVLMTVGYLYVRWRLAASKAASATQKAQALEAARQAELRIAEKRAVLAFRQRKIREQIAGERGRDGFSDQGWGP